VAGSRAGSGSWTRLQKEKAMSRVPLRRSVPLALVFGAFAIAPAFAAKGGKAQVIDWKMSPMVDLDMDARGRMQYKGPAGKAQFSVSVQRMAGGTYSFDLDGSPVRAFDVGRDGNGKLLLSEKKGTLGFDPRGGDVAVSKEGLVFLTATFPASLAD